MYVIENWYDPPCVLDASRSPIYDVFACELSGSYDVDDMGLPRGHTTEHLCGEWIVMLGPYYTRQAMLRARGLYSDGDMSPTFLSCPYFTTAMVAFPHAWVERFVLETWGSTRLTLEVARPSLRQGFLSIATLAKFDAPYVVEWVRYHQSIGVEHFYIYNNGSTELSAALAPLVSADEVTEISWPYPYRVGQYHWFPWWPNDSHLYCQPPQMMHAVRKFGHKWTWMALIDCDEFLVPRRHDSLVPILRDIDASSVGGVTVPGQWFGNNRKHGPPTGSIRKTYFRRERGYTTAPKVIASPRNVRASLIHWLAATKPIPVLPPEELSFNHYSAVSAHHARWGPEYDSQHNDVVDTRIQELCP